MTFATKVRQSEETMVKRKRTSRKKRTSRRNTGGQSFKVGSSTITTHLSAARGRALERAADLVASWKRQYVTKYGHAADFELVADEATARLHRLLDEGAKLKDAYEETVHFFNAGDEHLADFADDCAHLMAKLIREDGYTASDARVAIVAGATRALSNRRKRASKRNRRRSR